MELNIIKKIPSYESLADTIKEEIKKWRGLSREEIQNYRNKLDKLPRFFWVMENHFRGASAHCDFRIKMNDHLEGATIAHQVKGAIPDIDSIEKAKEISEEMFGSNPEKYWKFYPNMPPAKHCYSEPKANQPLIWLTFVKDVVEPGAVGATRFESGIFYGVDWGLGKIGANKPWFKEYFLYGSKFQGEKIGYKRLVFRLLPRRKEWTRIGKEEFHFEAFLTSEDAPPYILTQRAREKADYVPPDEISGLPYEFEEMVPAEMRWWDKKYDKDEKLKRIDSFYNFLSDKDIITGKKMNLENKNKLELTDLENSSNEILRKTKFVLHRIWWRGQKVVRFMPVTNYRFRFTKSDGKLVQIIFDEDPTIERVSGFAGLEKILDYGPPGKSDEPSEWFNFEGLLPAKSKENPNKELEAKAEIMDSGYINFIEENPNFRSFTIDGRVLKGYFILKRESPESDFWLFQRSALPGEKQT